VEDKRDIVGRRRKTARSHCHPSTLPNRMMPLRFRPLAPSTLATLALSVNAGCASVTAPFDKMRDAPMTVLRLQNFEPASQAQTQTASSGLQSLSLPPQISQWITAGASMLPPGLLPPGLLPGAIGSSPPAADSPRFHGFRILEGQPVTDSGVRGDIVDLFGHGSNFQDTTSNCMFAEFGFAIAQANVAPVEVLVSLSCEQVQPFNVTWPYSRTGLSPAAAQKVVSIAQRVFQGR
jgi:hypothetical protein